MRWFHLLLLLLTCCSETVRITGNASETGNTIQGVALYDDGSPAQHAFVKILPVTFYSGSDTIPKYDSTVTDQNGFFKLKAQEPVDQRLEIRDSQDFAVSSVVPFDSVNDPDSLQSQLVPAINLSTQINKADSNFYNSRVYLYGTHYTTNVDAEGNFVFESLPQGNYELRFVSNDSVINVANLPVLSDQDSTEIHLGLNKKLLVENFEDGDNQTLVGRDWGGGWWFSYGDNLDGGASQILPSSFPESVFSALETEGSYQGNSLKLNFEMDAEHLGAYYTAGFQMGTSDKSYDLSKLDSIHLWMKGQGSIRLQFENKVLSDSLLEWRHYGKTITLEKNWNLFSIASKDLDVPTGSKFENETWETVAQAIISITFKAEEDVELWLDDVTIYGLDYVIE